MHAYAIVLAGGRGSRLPIAGNIPKQFAPKFNGVTFVQDIVRMIIEADIRPTRIIIVVTNEEQKKLAEEQLGPKGVPSTNIVQFDPHYGYVAVQAKAIAYVYKHDPEAVCFLSPSDQHIEKEEQFTQAIQLAYREASNGTPIQIGAKVSDANIVGGCGNARYDDTQSGPVYNITAFIEKPLKIGGEAYVEKIMTDGNTAVNTGFYMVKAKQFLEQYPEKLMDDMLHKWYETHRGDDIGLDPTEMVIKLNMKLIIGRFDWKDCGTLKAYYDIQPKTTRHRNASIGYVSRYKCLDSLFICPIKKMHLYATGIVGCAIYASINKKGKPQAFAANMDMSQEVGKIADLLESEDAPMSYSIDSINCHIMPSNMSDDLMAVYLGVQNIEFNVVEHDDGDIYVYASGDGKCRYNGNVATT